jgi:hypothetical protein
MVILGAGLYLSAGLGALATWLSLGAGYPMEVAAVRGLLAFMAVGFVAYIAELVVMTAPPPAVRTAAAHEGADDAGDEDLEEPVSLPAMRAERDAAAGDRRAA